MFTFLVIALILFGIGATLGIAWALIRHGIPIFYKGTKEVIVASIEGGKKGWREAEERFGRR